MKPSGLEQLMARRLGWSVARVQEALHVTTHTITHQLAVGNSVRIGDLGTFRSHRQGRRRWFSALIGAVLLSPDRTVVRFRASQSLKDRLNRG